MSLKGQRSFCLLNTQLLQDLDHQVWPVGHNPVYAPGDVLPHQFGIIDSLWLHFDVFRMRFADEKEIGPAWVATIATPFSASSAASLNR